MASNGTPTRVRSSVLSIRNLLSIGMLLVRFDRYWWIKPLSTASGSTTRMDLRIKSLVEVVRWESPLRQVSGV